MRVVAPICCLILALLVVPAQAQFKILSDHFEGSQPFVYRGLHCDPQGYAYSVCNAYGGQFNRIKFDATGYRVWQHHNIGGYVQGTALDSARGRLYIVGDDYNPGAFIRCIDTQSGLELWTRNDTPMAATGAVSVGDDGSVYTFSMSNGFAIVVKYDVQGNTIWQTAPYQAFGELFQGFGYSLATIAFDSNQDLIVGNGGYSWDGPLDGVVAKISKTNGDLFWKTRTDLWRVSRILVDGPRCYAVGAAATSGWTGSTVALDLTNGSVLWQVDSTGLGQGWREIPYEACLGSDGSIYWTGGSDLWDQQNFAYIDWRSVTERIDSQGNVLWRKVGTSPNGSFSNSLLPEASGGIIVASGEGRLDGGLDRALTSYRPDGTVRWRWSRPAPGVLTRTYPFSTTLCPTNTVGGYLLGVAQENSGGGLITSRLQRLVPKGPGQ